MLQEQTANAAKLTKASAKDPPATTSAGTLSGWGRLSVPGYEVRSEDLVQVTEGAGLSRGLGRSYGDSSLPAPGRLEVVGTTLADRILSFDARSGSLRAEAGFSLHELNRIFLPRGWFAPVTPGTQYVTLGGMVASDVHGKNHHLDGCFGEHVTALKMRVADDRILECGPLRESELFWATVGGMGLTGHILEVEVTLTSIPSPWIWMESERIPSLDAFLAGLKSSASGWPFTMGWIDCLSSGKALGRGILMRGRWATPEEAPRAFPRAQPQLSMPFELPSFVLNPVTVRAFNTLYYWKHLRRQRRSVAHWQSFFYPLDKIQHWNRMYGRRGFTQYQCVLPEAAGPAGVRRFLELLARLGGASFLCVIKDCGAQGAGWLSFPMPGISIALDIAVRESTQSLVDRLNELVIEEGGRIYLTKDSFTRQEHFAQMEPRLAKFQEVRRRWDPRGLLKSAQSVRMLGDRA